MCSRWSGEILEIRTRILAPALMTFCPHSTGLCCSMFLLTCLNLKYCSLVLTRLTVFCLFVVASSDSPLLTNFRLHSRHGSQAWSDRVLAAHFRPPELRLPRPGLLCPEYQPECTHSTLQSLQYIRHAVQMSWANIVKKIFSNAAHS